MNQLLFSFLRWVLMVCLCSPAVWAEVIYVKNGNVRGDGASWATAYGQLHTAIRRAESGDEIWLAKGVYRPSGSKRDRFYYLGDHVRIYGGFKGDETTREQAKPYENITVLSGDINKDDEVDEHGVTLSFRTHGQEGSNSSWCLFRIKDAVGVVIDGLVICGGEGDEHGGGVLCLGSSSVTMSRCVVRGNKGGNGGGIRIIDEAHLALLDCWVVENQAVGVGGGVSVTGARLTIERCWIAGNQVEGQGGALGIHREGATVTIRDSVISGNRCGKFGSAMQCWTADTLIDLTNVTITGNQVEEGRSAAIHLGNGGRLVARNSLVWGNGRSYRGSGSEAIWTNCLIENSCGSESWNVNYQTDGGGNVDFDPKFLVPLDWNQAPSLDGDFMLARDSPAKGLGDETLTSSAMDYNRAKRVMGDGLEIGAHEIFEESPEDGGLVSTHVGQNGLPWVIGGGVALLSLLAWGGSRSKVTLARAEILQMQDDMEGVLEREKNFTSETSHELRTPIAVILGHCELALDEGRDPEQVREAVKSCQRAGERMKSLTDDLLEISRMDKGKVELDFVECSIREVAEDALDIVESAAAQKGVAIRDELEDVTIIANGDRLWQVMVNLLNNAVRHTPGGKSVTLRVARRGDCVEIAVIDQGDGIPSEDIPHLFKRFYKGEDGDTGLGLAICETVIKAHRGRLSVESEPGVETQFVATLPLKE